MSASQSAESDGFLFSAQTGKTSLRGNSIRFYCERASSSTAMKKPIIGQYLTSFRPLPLRWAPLWLPGDAPFRRKTFTGVFGRVYRAGGV